MSVSLTPVQAEFLQIVNKNFNVISSKLEKDINYLRETTGHNQTVDIKAIVEKVLRKAVIQVNEERLKEQLAAIKKGNEETIPESIGDLFDNYEGVVDKRKTFWRNQFKISLETVGYDTITEVARAAYQTFFDFEDEDIEAAAGKVKETVMYVLRA